MKQRIIILIAAMILIAAFGACKKETEVTIVKETSNTVTEPAKDEVKITEPAENTIKPTEPAVTIEPSSIPQSEGEDTAAVNNPILMPVPPFSYYLSDSVEDKASQSIKLDMKSSESNEITDDENWFINNDLSLNEFQVPNSFRSIGGNLPEDIAVTWNDLIITAAFYDDTYIYCTYGANFAEGYILNIYDAKTLQITYTIDFSNYRYSPDFISADYDYIQQKISWATIKDNVLYISHSHNTYAKSSNDMNAYITAIDLTDMSIIWRTDALVSNAHNFLLIDDVIICGYGFTAEPDYLYQVNLNTGEVLDRILVKSAPSYIIKKDNVLFVRTYNMNYEFEIME